MATETCTMTYMKRWIVERNRPPEKGVFKALTRRPMIRTEICDVSHSKGWPYITVIHGSCKYKPNVRGHTT